MLFELIKKRAILRKKISLNPYSNGICSLSPLQALLAALGGAGLNPYSNGICSLRVGKEVR